MQEIGYSSDVRSEKPNGMVRQPWKLLPCPGWEDRRSGHDPPEEAGSMVISFGRSQSHSIPARDPA